MLIACQLESGLCVVQAVAAAAEAKQAAAIGPVPPPNPTLSGSKRPSASEKPKPLKPKSMIAIKKHARASSSDTGVRVQLLSVKFESRHPPVRPLLVQVDCTARLHRSKLDM